MFAEDRQLAEHCAALARASEEGIAWVERNPDIVRAEAPETIKVLRRSVDQFKRLEIAALRKMCVGVFGPSQNGKSYLISSLARAGDEPLMANFAGKLIDFLADINPVGDKEATGLVTRFTIDRPQNLPADHPVQLRLLTETDIVKIIGNTYYSDFDHKDTPDADPAAISKRLDELQARAQAQPVDKLRAHHLADLEEYFRRFRVNQRVKCLASVFWARAAAIAPGLGAEDRAKLFATIWGDIDSLTALYKRLYGALKALDFAPEAFTTLDALMPREKSIIDVATLGGLGTDEGDRLALVTREGRKTQLLRSETTALTTELIIVVDQRPFDFFDHTDLLDFPGARPRKKFPNAAMHLSQPGAIKEPFIRGKVAYLFERYCAERELTSMLLCIKGGNMEVPELPGMIDEWLADTHGKSAEERTGREISLFFILTMFDLMLGEKGGDKGDFTTRWANRLEASMLNPFGEWATKWDKGGAFSNIYWIRNPTVLNRGLFDYNESDRETGVRQDFADKVAAFKDGFVNNPVVKQHFKQPEASWDAVMKPRDGGIGRLTEQLRPICNPELKRRQLKAQLAGEIAKVDVKLRQFLQTGDREEELQKKRLLARQLGRGISLCAQAQRFGDLLQIFQISDHDLYDVYYRLGADQSAETNGEAKEAPRQVTAIIDSRVDQADIFAEVFGDAPPPPPPNPGAAAAESGPSPVDEAERYAIEIEKLWFQRLTEVAETKEYHRYFQMPAEDFDKVVHEIRTGYQRMGMRGMLTRTLRDASRFKGMQRSQLIWKQAAAAANILNTYIDWLGRDPRSVPEDKRMLIVGGRSRTVFKRPGPNGPYPALAPEATYDRDFYVDWLMAFVALMEENVEGNAGFDRAQNDALASIVGTLGKAA